MLRKLLLMVCCLFGMVAQAEWVSPHPLSLEEKAPAALIPFPQKVSWGKGSLKLEGKGLKFVGETKGKMVRTAMAAFSRFKPSAGGEAEACVLRLEPDALPAECAEEGYKLSVNEQGITLTAAKEAGLFYGLQTLRQLCAGKGSVPYCDIEDWPAFGMRGFLHDCGRNFQTIESLKKQLDIAAQIKVNFFQWHLTDHPAWHIQCKAYPVLNSPAHRTRDKRDTYSYAQIRELFAYARARNITIIPELDMPGHSAYFDRCFGFKMHTDKGMDILETLIDEFCREVPREICPYLHLGADEVKIPNAREFVARMSKKIMENGRIPAQWGGPRDLPVGEHSISQRWGEGGEMVDSSLKPETIHCRSYDSTMGYANLFDPALLVRRYFFMRPCGVGRGDDMKMGTMFCIWPDTRVDDKSRIPLHSAQWPGMCAMAERAWKGGDADGDKLPSIMPAPETEASKAYGLFEKRMQKLSYTVFNGQHFPFWPESSVQWTVIPPVPTDEADDTRQKVLAGQWDGLQPFKAYCANLYFRTKPNTGCLGIFSKARPGVTAWAVTEIDAPKAGPAPFMMGFDAPARSSRRYSGVPKAGEWSQCGTRIWVNGKEVRNPQTYKLAGQKRCEHDTWTSPLNEEPIEDDEIWWAHKPTPIPLRKGKNTIVIEQPYTGEYQSWGVSLIPLQPNDAKRASAKKTR